MESEIKILNPNDKNEIARCFSVFTHLRADLEKEEFIRRVQLQSEEGYEIAYIESGFEIVAAAGFRILHFLAWGRVLYLDDLITRPDLKRSGYGSALIEWIAAHGKKNACQEMHLDTGYQRHDAHRLYLKAGMNLNCHHLSKAL